MHKTCYTILVVDDQPINVKLLQRKLEREGMNVLTAFNGQQCLEIVEDAMPDLILLDVMMPEMDGIEVCRQLKLNEETQSIPIIFITAKSTKEGKLEGLGAGGADYITKPIDLEETLARVNTQLRIQEIHRQNLELSERLADARQTAAIGAITQGIAHNLNNLLGVVVGYLDLIKSGYDSPDMVRRSTLLMDQAIQRMVVIVRQLSTIATEENVPTTAIRVNRLIESSIDRFQAESGLEDVDIEVDAPADNPLIHSNPEVFETMIGKLYMNAFESYPKNTDLEERSITLNVSRGSHRGKNCLMFSVMDRGIGVEVDIADHIFEPFITTKTSVGRGMGLTIARHAARNINGELQVSPRDGGGTVATIYHPIG